MAFREPEIDEPVPVLSIGSIVGGPESSEWRSLIGDLSNKVVQMREGLESPLRVNIVFHVPGSILSPDFAGVRTASWSAQRSALMIQVALPPEVPHDGREQLRKACIAAVDEAERWAARRGFDTAVLHDLVRSV